MKGCLTALLNWYLHSLIFSCHTALHFKQMILVFIFHLMAKYVCMFTLLATMCVEVFV